MTRVMASGTGAKNSYALGVILLFAMEKDSSIFFIEESFILIYVIISALR